MSAERGHKLTIKKIPATETKPAQWRTRVTIGKAPNTSRPWIELPVRSGESEEHARQRALRWAEEQTTKGLEVVPGKTGARARAAASRPEGETVEAYAERWCADRERRGLTSVDTYRGLLKKWIVPVLGALPIATVQRTDIKRLVEHLDASVRAEKISWKTSQNAWGLATSLFRDTAEAKTVSLCVRDDNPAGGVRGPDRGVKVAKVIVHPDEFKPIVEASDDVVPLRWKRAITIGIYLYLRAAEERGLHWEDFDRELRWVHVHRTIDEHGVEGSTKSEEARRVPIEPNLRPMLEVMREEAKGNGRVLPDMPSEDALAGGLRRYLLAVGVDRPELHRSTKTRRRLRWHDLRASGITWRCVRDRDLVSVMRAAGHKDLATTQLYMRDVEQVRDTFGDVFPPLPEAITGGPPMRPAMRLSAGIMNNNKCEGRDLNPHGVTR